MQFMTTFSTRQFAGLNVILYLLCIVLVSFSTPSDYIFRYSKRVFRSWSRSSAVSPQVTEAINPAVGCHYFPPGPRLPPQPPSITAHWPVPNYTARRQRHMCVKNLPKENRLYLPIYSYHNTFKSNTYQVVLIQGTAFGTTASQIVACATTVADRPGHNVIVSLAENAVRSDAEISPL